MKINKLFTKLLVLAGTAAFSHGASITIGDSGFEANVGGPGAGGDLASGGWSNNLSTEWEERDGVDNGASFEEFIPGFSSEGTDHIGVATGYYIWQDTGVALQPNTTYTLTVGVGRRGGQTAGGNVSTFAIVSGLTGLGTLANTAAVLADPITLASGSFDATTIATDLTFVDAPDLVFTTGAVVPSENVVVLLGDNSPGGRSHFDNIRLDATAIPEPSTSLLGMLAIFGLMRRRR